MIRWYDCNHNDYECKKCHFLILESRFDGKYFTKNDNGQFNSVIHCIKYYKMKAFI